MTAQEFIQDAPLYTKAAIRDFSAPNSITRMCTPCRRETTWQLSDTCGITLDTSPQANFHGAGYTCVLCRNNSFLVLYRLLDWSEDNPRTWSHKAVQKIGQLPSASIDVPADLSDRLGTTAEHYKKALVCRNVGYGIAAIAYMRRVVEEKTDALIDVVAELANTFGVDQKDIEAIRDAKKQVRYEDKLRVASELIPSTLRPGDVNPLGQLYTHLSVGLHGKTDDECIAICDDLRADFEYVFRNLHVQAKERREFAERVTKRVSKST